MTIVICVTKYSKLYHITYTLDILISNNCPSLISRFNHSAQMKGKPTSSSNVCSTQFKKFSNNLI